MKNCSFKPRSRVNLAVLALLNLSALAANAQTAAAQDKPEVTQMEKVVVTATKREAVLTDVSLGISAISEKALEARGITTLEDLGTTAAGMNIIKTSPGENLIVSRGISTSQSLSIQSGPAVGVYIDEMPLVGMTSGVPDFGLWDVSRVEMLRGPQGTLYGESAMAGTIRIISNAPEASKFAAKVQLTQSSVKDGSSGQSLRAMVNIPLSEGVAALRATVSSVKDPAWIDVPDLKIKDANTRQQTDSRLALRLTPNARLKIDASIWHQQSDGKGSSNQTSPGIYSPPALGIITGLGVAPIANGQLNSDNRSADLLNLTVNYDFGAFSLVSATSQAKQTVNTITDARDTLPIGLLDFGVPAAVMSYVVPNSSALDTRKGSLTMSSEELRLVSNGDQRFNWTVGGYFKKLDRSVNNNWNFNIPNLPFADNSLVVSDTSSNAKAYFGEADLKLSEAVTATAGLRSYSDTRKATANVKSFSNVFGVPVGVYSTNSDEQQTTYNAILSWKPNPQMNLFARAASGFRSGGPNLWVQDPVHIPLSFKAEKIQSVELGLKSNPASWLVANVYVYKNDWNDKQINLSTPNGLYDYTANASTATAQGAEFELQAYPSKGLSLSAALTYTDASITKDLLNSGGKLIAKSGSQLPYVSPWELKASVDYRWPLAEGRTAVANLGYVYRNANYSDISNAASTNNGSLNLVNLRAGLESFKKTWGIFGTVRNLGNATSISTIQQATGGYGVRYPSYIQPRTIGIELQAAY